MWKSTYLHSLLYPACLVVANLHNFYETNFLVQTCMFLSNVNLNKLSIYFLSKSTKLANLGLKRLQFWRETIYCSCYGPLNREIFLTDLIFLCDVSPPHSPCHITLRPWLFVPPDVKRCIFL